MIAIIDYGSGNIFSLQSSLKAIGQEVIVTRDPAEIQASDHIILPGVGAFEDAAQKLHKVGLFEWIRKEARAKKPILGICLGMQLLFDQSTEYGLHQGLGLIHGEVRGIEDVIPKDLDIPHMGWNRLIYRNPSPLFQGIPEGSFVYFVHSYAAFDCEKDLIAQAEYGCPLTAAVQHGNVCGTQFHPEKSGPVGLKILQNFCAM
ncbi:MAG: imidazole glycerol phosphate synthase subunit HisH [Lachnospiraceae bacterium]|nr:imidazole glycerol phosphate synthase subunit HisH [Lachnospiraceae bacterium]